jgi:hypothetical protein
MTAQDDWLGLLNSIMRDVNDFAGSGDYRLAGALVVLAQEARRAAVTVRAAHPHRPRSRRVSLTEGAVQP